MTEKIPERGRNLKIENKLVFRLAAVLGLLGMIAGSAGAHGIKFEPGKKILFDTGLLYLFIHLPVLMVLGTLGISRQAYLMLGGVVLFSVPLVAKGIGIFDGGIIVPTGGMLMIASWVWLIFAGNPGKKED